MSTNIQLFAGSYYLERAKRLRRIPIEQAGSEPIRTLIDLLLNSRIDARLNLLLQQGNMGQYLGGQISCQNNTQQFSVYANHITPEYDLEGVIYAYKGEIVFAARANEQQIRMELYADGVSGQNGFYSYQFLWIKRLMNTATINLQIPQPIGEQMFTNKITNNKYPLDAKLIGHWRFGEYMSSSGFSYYREINMVLAQNGRFIRTSQSFASGAYQNQYGDWLGMTTKHTVPANERGDWGVVNGQLYLYFDDEMYTDCSYEILGNSMLCYYSSGRQYWEKIR